MNSQSIMKQYVSIGSLQQGQFSETLLKQCSYCSIVVNVFWRLGFFCMFVFLKHIQSIFLLMQPQHVHFKFLLYLFQKTEHVPGQWQYIRGSYSFLLLHSWLASSNGSKYLNWQPAHSGWKLDSSFDHTLMKASIQSFVTLATKKFQYH